MKKILIVASLFLLVSCGGESETKKGSQEIGKKEDKVLDSKVDSKEVVSLETGSLEMVKSAEEYIDSMLLTDYPDMQEPTEVAMYVSSNGYLVIGLNNSSEQKKYKLEIGDFNDTYLEVKPVFHDFDPSTGNGNELVLNWMTSDGTNGMEDGFEMERRGIVVMNLQDGSSYLNLCYYDEYSTYSVSENFDSNTSDVHGKMAEDTEWERCALNTQFAYLDGKMHVTRSEIDSVGKCDLTPIEIGAYTFDEKLKKFVLDNGK